MTQADQKQFRLRAMFQEIDLPPGIYIIGRSPFCTITLEDPLVSRQHTKITVSTQHVEIEDLDSTNGTLVNNRRLVGPQDLAGQDRVRIGSHVLQLVEKPLPAQGPLRVTVNQINCPRCHIPFAETARQCPNCQTVVIADRSCTHCHAPLHRDATECDRCHTPVEDTDDTIPIDLPHGSADGGNNRLLDEVIEKALSIERFDQADTLLEARIKRFEHDTRTQKLNPNELARISKYNLRIAQAERSEARVTWMLETWTKYAAVMPESLILFLDECTSGWYDVSQELRTYAEALKRSGKADDLMQAAPGHIQDLLRRTP